MQNEMQIQAACYVGDVTALHYLDLGQNNSLRSCLLAGIYHYRNHIEAQISSIKGSDTHSCSHAGTGSRLIAHSLSRSDHQASITVFDDGTRVHGIDSCRHPNGAVLLVVHGGRRAKACACCMDDVPVPAVPPAMHE